MIVQILCFLVLLHALRLKKCVFHAYQIVPIPCNFERKSCCIFCALFKTELTFKFINSFF